MPQLITFALAEKCLITKEGAASLITILQRVDVRVQASKDPQVLPGNAVAPLNWCVYSLWRQEAEDKGAEFSKVVQIFWPDKAEFLKRSVQFRFTEEKNHNVLINLSGFPAGQEGSVTVNMWLERESQRITEVKTWTIEVKHTPVDAGKQEAPTFQ